MSEQTVSHCSVNRCTVAASTPLLAKVPSKGTKRTVHDMMQPQKHNLALRDDKSGIINDSRSRFHDRAANIEGLEQTHLNRLETQKMEHAQELKQLRIKNKHRTKQRINAQEATLRKWEGKLMTSNSEFHDPVQDISDDVFEDYRAEEKEDVMSVAGTEDRRDVDIKALKTSDKAGSLFDELAFRENSKRVVTSFFHKDACMTGKNSEVPVIPEAQKPRKYHNKVIDVSNDFKTEASEPGLKDSLDYKYVNLLDMNGSPFVEDTTLTSEVQKALVAVEAERVRDLPTRATWDVKETKRALTQDTTVEEATTDIGAGSPSLESGSNTTASMDDLHRYKIGWNIHRKPLHVPTSRQAKAAVRYPFHGFGKSSTTMTSSDLGSSGEQAESENEGWAVVQRRGSAALKSRVASGLIRKEITKPAGGFGSLVQLTTVTDPDEERHAKWVLERPMNPYGRWQTSPKFANVRYSYA